MVFLNQAVLLVHCGGVCVLWDFLWKRSRESGVKDAAEEAASWVCSFPTALEALGAGVFVTLSGFVFFLARSRFSFAICAYTIMPD